jgi:hypothetical protein
MVPFLISEFDKETLSNLVKECFGSGFPDIVKKRQIRYIYSYLTDLSAKTILLESNYVDKDYLEDYSRYYVKCFNRYGERCARLHFFSEELDHVQLEPLFNDSDPIDIIEKLKKSYLGFIVIKPLPKTFIGKTCLSVYPSLKKSNNKKIITKGYNVNLFGIALQVETVAFQEQDKVLSACATASIWTTLHAHPDKTPEGVPSLSEITLSAINYITDSTNSFPTSGLTNKQILRALDQEKLRNHTVNFSKFNEDDQDAFFQTVKAYIDSDIPLILGVNVFETINGQSKLKEKGQHAVVILGYKDVNNSDKALYIHDDRHGPYAIAKLSHHPEKEKDTNFKKCITLREKDDTGNWHDSSEVFIPESLIIPNNKKIRITSELVRETAESICSEIIAYMVGLEPSGQYDNCIQYQHSLETLSSCRNRILHDKRVKNKKTILTESAARYQWCCKFTIKGKLTFEILFDSTEIPQGDAVSNIIIYEEKTYELVADTFLELLPQIGQLSDSQSTNFLVPFISKFNNQDHNYTSHLDEEYGELRAPKRVKKSETSGNSLTSQENIYHLYQPIQKNLINIFNDYNEEFLIWAISEDGAILIGKEENGQGHPTLTKFKPARIAGELRLDNKGLYINSKSGRYSTDYEDVNKLLNNALRRFKEIFPEDKHLEAREYYPKTSIKKSPLTDKVKEILAESVENHKKMKKLYPLLRSQGQDKAHAMASKMIAQHAKR